MSDGYSFETFGAIAGVAKDTLYKWAEKHDDFADAKKRAFLECQLFWERLGIDGVRGKYEGFSAATWIFNMKNRFQWRDRQDIEVSEKPPLKLAYNLEWDSDAAADIAKRADTETVPASN